MQEKYKRQQLQKIDLSKEFTVGQNEFTIDVWGQRRYDLQWGQGEASMDDHKNWLGMKNQSGYDTTVLPVVTG